MFNNYIFGAVTEEDPGGSEDMFIKLLDMTHIRIYT